MRQLHELRGSIALVDKRGAEAVKELTQANQQDHGPGPTALAFRESGDARQAAAFAGKAARFNGLAFNYGYVRTKAATLAVGSASAKKRLESPVRFNLLLAPARADRKQANSHPGWLERNNAAVLQGVDELRQVRKQRSRQCLRLAATLAAELDD